jgi:hypothetical protein
MMNPSLRPIAVALLAGATTLWMTACSQELSTGPLDKPPAGAAPTDATAAVIAANDDFDDAVEINALPFTHNVNTSDATTAADDPADPEDPAVCFIGGHTVWYQFTPSKDIRINANTSGSDYDTGIAVFTGTRGALTMTGCNDDVLLGREIQSSVTFDAVAGETYFFMVGSFGNSPGGNLLFNLKLARGQDPLEQTFVFRDEGSFTQFEDCLGEEVLIEFINRVVLFTRRDARGNVHVRTKVLDVGTTFTGLTSGIVWSLHGPFENFSLNGDDSSEEAPGTITFVQNATLIGPGQAPNLRVRIRFHLTINANETVTVERERVEVVCR